MGFARALVGLVVVAASLMACYPRSGQQTRDGDEAQADPQASQVVDGVEAPLYGLDQAVEDALSGSLSHIGTGPWNGIARIHACAYRNDQVIVVDVYCTLAETNAFRVDVYSPTRGHVRIYAEGSAPVSTLTRDAYFTFKAESHPAPPAEVPLVPLTLSVSMAELQDYEAQRYNQFLPGCFGGVEMGRPQGGCLAELEPHKEAWLAANRPFLSNPPPSWYRLVEQLRELARTHGHAVVNPGG